MQFFVPPSFSNKSLLFVCLLLRQLFVPLLFFDNLHICTSEPFLVILCDTLFRRSKLIFFKFECAETYKFLYIKDASFSCKILLKLIISSLVIVGWRGIVLNISHCLQLLQQSRYIFVLHTAIFLCIYPHIEQNSLNERR